MLYALCNVCRNFARKTPRHQPVYRVRTGLSRIYLSAKQGKLAETQNFSMKKHPLLALLLTLLGVLQLTGCDTTSDYTIELSRTCIVSEATLGSLNRSVTVRTAAGKDTTLTSTVTGANYPLYIDQVNNRIYNADSLPVGTDITKVTFSSITSSAYLLIKQIDTQKDTTFATTDSTDFSQSRIVSAVAADGVSRKDYTMELRVHKEEADTFSWQTVASGTASALTGMVDLLAVADSRQLYIYGKDADGAARVISTGTAVPEFSSSQLVDLPSGKQLNTRSVRLYKGVFFALATDGTLLQASVGNGRWTTVPVSSPATFTALAGSSTDSIYALAADRIYASADAGKWTPCASEQGEALPADDVEIVCLPSHTDATYESVVLVGERDGAMSVWKREIDMRGDFSFPWYSLPQSADLAGYGAPKLASSALLKYDDAALMVGVLTDGTISPFYLSRDFGRTWKTGELKHPDMSGVTSMAAAVDADHYIWILCAGSNSVYKGRVNRLGWSQDSTRFEKMPKHP